VVPLQQTYICYARVPGKGFTFKLDVQPFRLKLTDKTRACVIIHYYVLSADVEIIITINYMLNNVYPQVPVV